MHMKYPSLGHVATRKDAGRPCSCEVNPWALFLATWENVEEARSLLFKLLGAAAHVEALWKGYLATAPSTLSARITRRTQRRERHWLEGYVEIAGRRAADSGLSQPVLTAINEGKLTARYLVRITSYNPARIFGVYPRKGVIQLGADADMVIVDMNKEEVISNETTYTKVGWTPSTTRKVKESIRTIVRGKPL